MKKKITLTLDPCSQFALWLIVLLLAADRLKSFLPITEAQAQESGKAHPIDINLVQIGGSQINEKNGIPVRQCSQTCVVESLMTMFRLHSQRVVVGQMNIPLSVIRVGDVIH